MAHAKKILITGNMGYVGSSLVRHLRTEHPEAVLIGFDAGYFARCLTNAEVLPECRLDAQYFGDVRDLPEALFNGVDAVVHLAAISNDPMGQRYEQVTLDVNYRAAVAAAETARRAGVRSFVFASSCSVYGFSEQGARTERCDLNPLTAYARSKVAAEKELLAMASDDFHVTCLRFATACGMSDRLRLDLVVNDFVAGAVAARKITILSDGTPWRPLIHVRDMARAFDWAVHRNGTGGSALVVNAGSDEWNYQVRELAAAVRAELPDIEVFINADAQPDKRSYRVDFSLFRSLAPNHQPRMTLSQTIHELREGLEAMRFCDPAFRESSYMRLRELDRLRSLGLLDEQLHWTRGMTGRSAVLSSLALQAT